MSLFKQKISFHQFLADLISFQFDFLDSNFDKLIVLADEFKVLTDGDKKEFLDKSHELVIADIFISCTQHSNHKLSPEEIGKSVGAVYGQYSTTYKKMSELSAREKMENVINLLELANKLEEELQKRHDGMVGHTDDQKFYLCSAFSEYCAGGDSKSKNWEGKKFAAFKLAKAIVKGDVVMQSLKHTSVNF